MLPAQPGVEITKTRKLCSFLCHPKADLLNVMTPELFTGQDNFNGTVTSPQPVRRNSWTSLPFLSHWHVNSSCAFFALHSSTLLTVVARGNTDQSTRVLVASCMQTLLTNAFRGHVIKRCGVSWPQHARISITTPIVAPDCRSARQGWPFDPERHEKSKRRLAMESMQVSAKPRFRRELSNRHPAWDHHDLGSVDMHVV